MQEVSKIVIIGPESTGKSTLCRQLANHYNTLWCPEYAREYLHTNGSNYNYDDLLLIAKGQLNLEGEYVAQIQNSKVKRENSDLLFIDTNMYVMKVWCEFVFENCHQYILNEIAARSYDLYMLCDIDLPWVEDELREYPDIKSRQILYHIYEDILVNQEVPWVKISGDYSDRFQKAVNAVDQFIFSSPS